MRSRLNDRLGPERVPRFLDVGFRFSFCPHLDTKNFKLIKLIKLFLDLSFCRSASANTALLVNKKLPEFPSNNAAYSKNRDESQDLVQLV